MRFIADIRKAAALPEPNTLQRFGFSAAPKFNKTQKLQIQRDWAYALLEDGKTLSVKVDKSIQELDDISDDPHIPIHTKTQIWDLFSKLELIKQ